MEYKKFIEEKLSTVHSSGFTIDESKINPLMFPFQKWTTIRSLEKGKFAVFADCGLGKTFMQLEIASQVVKHTGKPFLILCPLAVAGQTIKEGERFGIAVKEYQGEHETGIYIANYEQLDNVHTSAFGGVALDESSILKNFNGAMRNKLIESFKDTPYRFCFTATPSPNDPMELGNHAEFLGVMKRSEMLGQFFVNDASRSSKYRLKRHGVQDFYKWVGTWAVMFSKPSDIGFSDEGYNLPPLNIEEVEVKTPKKDEWALFNTQSVSATTLNQELRITLVPRIEEAAKVINSIDKPFICWVKQNAEGDKVTALLNGAVQVKGSDKPEVKKKNLLGFADGDFRVLVTKAKIAQFGLNYQHCSNQVFLGLDFSFEGLYQALKRSHRFGQKNPVNVVIITTDTMQNVVSSIKRKQHEFERMQAEMTAAICANMENKAASQAAKKEVATGKNWELWLGDAVELIRHVEDNSIDYSFQSPPFSSLYTYSDSPQDLSNCKSHAQFYEHFNYLIPEYYRVMKPGRLISFHLTQLTTGIGRDGYLSIIDFRGEIIRAMERNGFIFHAEVGIRKDPQLAAIRTKNIQLMHGQTKRDQAVNRPGLADYVVTFRKPGKNQVPIKFGDEGLDFEYWCKIAEPFWTDISESDTLQTRKEVGDERHMTPTQLETIRRSMLLWSNLGDTILSAFGGIQSEGTIAVELRRKYKAFELKKFYFDLGKGYMIGAEEKANQLSIV